MQIKNVKVYELNESIIASGYPMRVGEPLDFDGFPKHDMWAGEDGYNRAIKLANTSPSSGHSNFRKGILVAFDIKYAQYFTPQLQRYGHLTIVSSSSKMHNLTKIADIKEHCNKYVVETSCYFTNKCIRFYNEDKTEYPIKVSYLRIGDFLETDTVTIQINSKEELFQYIISNLPSGFELWMRCTTNYEQLATIYRQRRRHKLEDWREFCKWIETLPMADLLIINK